MAWQRVDTDPLDIDTGVAPARAQAIAAALVRRAVPLLVNRHGRPEPLASGALFQVDGRVLLTTCRHIFDDGVALGDLGVPRSHAPGVLWLRGAAARVIAHPQRDLAVIELVPGRTRDELLRHWPVVPLGADHWDRAPRAHCYVLAGWPYAQMRRVDHTMYARPVVFFAPPAWPPETSEGAAAANGVDDSDTSLRVRYARVARRCDGMHVLAPELDGVSGATLWAVLDDALDGGCVLQPAAVQYAFKHGAYARAEPLMAARALFDRVTRR
jgi:hypothetical protein